MRKIKENRGRCRFNLIEKLSNASASADVVTGRSYPQRPILAVSAAIIRDRKVLIVRRARPPADGLYTLPGGVVEAGETLIEAVKREVREETALTIEPVALAGYREAIGRDAGGRVERHFVILPFAARWIAGEPVLNEELSEAMWLDPPRIATLPTTAGLAEIVAAALAVAAAAG
jgi:8-oxo-dGTP diphosphatase